MTKEIHPQWVIVNGEIHRVSDFSHLPPLSRPKAICPLCMNSVIMKLGSERVHHYAHQPDVICVATQPETALHLNTKFYIYEQLLSGNRLYVEQQCSNGCGKSRIVTWVKDWERVEHEFAIGAFRPDILVVVSGATRKAIEVKVTHPVEDAKEAFYKRQNISWLEVDACESIYDGENAWRIDQPLPFAVCKPPLSEWACSSCQAQMRKEKEAELREQSLEEYRKHNFSEIIYAKMVDFYYPSGMKYRETYYLKKVVRNDEPVEVMVETGDTRDRKVVWQQNGEITEALRELAFHAVKTEVDKRRKAGAIVDDREWSPWVPGKKFVARDIERFPFLYEWDGSVRKWAKWEQQESDSENTHPKKPVIQPQDRINITMPEGVCVHCGQTTTDYWSFNGATRECKCRKCYREGKY